MAQHHYNPGKKKIHCQLKACHSSPAPTNSVQEYHTQNWGKDIALAELSHLYIQGPVLLRKKGNFAFVAHANMNRASSVIIHCRAYDIKEVVATVTLPIHFWTTIWKP